MNPFDPIIQKNKYLLLDGGLATELEKMGHNLDHPLWSAKVLIESPESIRRVNRSYLEAGSDIIVTASYQLSYPGAKEVGISTSETTSLLKRSVQIGKDAIRAYVDMHPAKEFTPLLAASMGPYGAFLANGAEYTGVYNVSKVDLLDFHERRWAVFAASQVDILAFETIPNIYEAETIRRLSEDIPEKPIWVSFCCKDAKHISDGTPIGEAASLFHDLDHAVGIGINCTAPSYILSLLELIKPVADGKEIMVYPNSGESYDVSHRCWIGERDPENYATQARQWYEAGARILGGCCRTGPEHIARIKEILEKKINQA
jgi:homocysteine S-methyltransferase